LKRLRERELDPDQDRPDQEAQGPLWVEPIARRRKGARYGLPIAVVAFVLVAFLVAMGSRYIAYFSASPAPSITPSPITWIDTIVTPTPDSGVTEPTAATRISVAARIDLPFQYMYQNASNHFTMELTNKFDSGIPLRPCPTYIIYLAGTDKSLAAERILNCAAIGTMLEPGRTVKLDMVYVPRDDDPIQNQTLVWEWVSPSTYRAAATVSVVIQPYRP
jgi:hypothetical protein